MVVIEDFYHTATITENINWMKLTHHFFFEFNLIFKKILNLRPPYCTSTFTSRNLITFLDVHTKEK